MAKAHSTIRNLLNRNGRYFARLVVPVGLREPVGKRELLEPLGADRSLALQKLPAAIARFQEILANARKGEPVRMFAVSASKAARDLYHSELDHDLRMRRWAVLNPREASKGASPAADAIYLANLLHIAHGQQSKTDYIDYEKAARKDALDKLVTMLNSSSYDDEGQIAALHNEMNSSETFIDANIGYAVAEACEGKASPTRGSEEWLTLVRELANARAESIRRKTERDKGDFSGRSKYDDPPEPFEGVHITLSGLLEGYAGSLSRSGRGVEMHKKGSISIQSLADYVGHEDARKITRSDVRRWIDKLRERLSEKTIRDSYVASLKAIFRHAVEEDMLTASPLAGIKLKVPKRQLVREKGYTHEEAARLLTVSLAHAPAVDAKQMPREGEKMTLAKQWVPLLCAFTGARVAEVCQLRTSDVFMQDDLACIRINPEAGSVKTGVYRDVPLHEILRKRGFLTVVERAPTGPLFFDLRVGRRGRTHPSKFVAGRVSQWLQSKGLVPLGVSPSHGFRHAFKSFGMEAGIDVRILDAIQGHAPRTAGEAYGDVSVAAKAAAIAKFPSLIDAQLGKS